MMYLNPKLNQHICREVRALTIDGEIKYFKPMIQTNLGMKLGFNGQPLNGGVFVYTLEVMCPDGNAGYHSGNVTLCDKPYLPYITGMQRSLERQFEAPRAFF